MKFNSFIWNNFIESEKGRASVEFFSTLRDRYKKSDAKLIQFLTERASHGTLDKYYVNAASDIERVLFIIKELEQSAKDKLIPPKIKNRTEVDHYFQMIGELAPDEDDEVLLFGIDNVADLSVALHCLHPEYFFPYYFYPDFDQLKTIFHEFGIFLPPVPPKQDYEKRFLYYLELCKSLYEFWTELKLNPQHLPTFLYNFAPEALTTSGSEKIVSKANRAWFVGGGINNNGDFTYLDQINSKSQAFWQGNKDTEVGDIIVMYCLSPRSCIHSIWRATRPGGAEPFRGFYGTIWMGNPIRVKPLALAEIKDDDILSQMPLVKGNMQGINGRQISKVYYDRLLELLAEKGSDINVLPKLENKELTLLKIKTERDVELKLLEPILHELNFEMKDWERQVSIRSGRNEKIIPDYLINVSKDRDAKSVKSDFVWEAKYSIETKDQLKKDFGQARSYAMLVDAKGIGLISKEGIWICMKANDFLLKNAIHWPASKIYESDCLAEIRTLAGKQALKNK